jgi:hypothetical protein
MTDAFYAVRTATDCGCRATLTICHAHRQDHLAREIITSWLIPLLAESEIEGRGSDT